MKASELIAHLNALVLNIGDFNVTYEEDIPKLRITEEYLESRGFIRETLEDLYYYHLPLCSDKYCDLSLLSLNTTPLSVGLFPYESYISFNYTHEIDTIINLINSAK